jgi:glutamyl-tRNA reductase
MRIVLVGLNHQTASVKLRERVAFSPLEAREAAGRLCERGILTEALVLSTCNRSEIYGVRSPSEDNDRGLEEFLASFHGLPLQCVEGSLYRYRDQDVIRHLYRVSSGLDSLLLGEAEILGQVRTAYRNALEGGTSGQVLNRLFQGALEIGKRVRSETGIGALPMSVAFAGVKLAEQIFGRLDAHRALIVGAGATSEKVVRHLRDRGLQHLRIVNRTEDHAWELACRYNGEVAPWEQLSEAIEWSDLVVTSVLSKEPVLTHEMAEGAMLRRGNRPLLLIDLGMPRNVAPAVADLHNVFLYNIDQLTDIVQQNKKAREGEIPRVESIIEEQIEKFMRWRVGVTICAALAEMEGKPAAERLACLHSHVESLAFLSPQERLYLAGRLERILNHSTNGSREFLRCLPELRWSTRTPEGLRELAGVNPQTA